MDYSVDMITLAPDTNQHKNMHFNHEQIFSQNNGRSQSAQFKLVSSKPLKYNETLIANKFSSSDQNNKSNHDIIFNGSLSNAFVDNRKYVDQKGSYRQKLIPALNLSRFNLSKSNKIESNLYSKVEQSNKPSTNKHRLILDTPFSTRSTISYGLIVFAKDTRRWAIIQRKHSVEFLLFMRGIYRLTYLPILLSCVTTNEALLIEECLKGGPDIFKDVYLNKLGLSIDGLSYALIRMAESRCIVINMLTKLDLLNNDLSWTWPKGRLHISSNRETPFDCAKREFVEEVEINLPPPLFISDTYVSENIRTITGRNIESRYWIYIIPEEIPMTPPESHPEVANRIWVDIETCRSKMGRDSLLNQVVSMVSFIE